MGMVSTMLDLHLDSRVCLPGTYTIPYDPRSQGTLQRTIEAKPTVLAQVSEAPQPVEPVDSRDAKIEENGDEKFQTYKTVNEV